MAAFMHIKKTFRVCFFSSSIFGLSILAGFLVDTADLVDGAAFTADAYFPILFFCYLLFIECYVLCNKQKHKEGSKSGNAKRTRFHVQHILVLMLNMKQYAMRIICDCYDEFEHTMTTFIQMQIYIALIISISEIVA